VSDVNTRLVKCARIGLLIVISMLMTLPAGAASNPAYAAFVIDARSGKVLHARNADARLNPASLTKMMTLYVVFEAVSNGELSLDQMITITAKAANEPPSKLGLRRGQKIKLRYLIRAAAVKSANDAATALGIAVSGSEAAFARRMNRTAKAIGMTRTTFKNAHGLTERGHLSTARDMSKLGRQLFFDYPDYYGLFSRLTVDAGVRKVSHTNRRLLNSYRGADGIKTGYTRASGFNIVASAKRGNERIIATVFGGRSTASRNARVAELLDMGFKRAPTQVALARPSRPPYLGKGSTSSSSSDVVRVASADAVNLPAGRVVRTSTNMTKSPRPNLRPGTVMAAASAPVDDATLLAMEQNILMAVAQVSAAAAPATNTGSGTDVLAALNAPSRRITPQMKPEELLLASLAPDVAGLALNEDGAEVVTRVSTSGGRYWGINIGQYGSRYKAERVLLKTALRELGTLDSALRKVVQRRSGFDANFMGLSRETAELACRRLGARGQDCTPIGPPS
jgi:D-alanyl-D-alanine carboxypeptidase